MADAVLVRIAEYHNDVVSSFKLFFGPASVGLTSRFVGRTTEEILDALSSRLEETDLRSAFFVLTSLEADFRNDYEYRCRKRKKDDLSRAFRLLYKSRGVRVSLEDEIFEAWGQNSTASRQLIGELRGAFNFRHWLAHGRYWTPKLGRKYDFNFVYSLADDVLNSFPLFPGPGQIV